MYEPERSLNQEDYAPRERFEEEYDPYSDPMWGQRSKPQQQEAQPHHALV